MKHSISATFAAIIVVKQEHAAVSTAHTVDQQKHPAQQPVIRCSHVSLATIDFYTLYSRHLSQKKKTQQHVAAQRHNTCASPYVEEHQRHNENQHGRHTATKKKAHISSLQHRGTTHA